MTNLNKFATQQLMKNQMNQVKGGTYYFSCSVRDGYSGEIVEWCHVSGGSTALEAMNSMADYLADGQVATDCRFV